MQCQADGALCRSAIITLSCHVCHSTIMMLSFHFCLGTVASPLPEHHYSPVMPCLPQRRHATSCHCRGFSSSCDQQGRQARTSKELSSGQHRQGQACGPPSPVASCLMHAHCLPHACACGPPSPVESCLLHLHVVFLLLWPLVSCLLHMPASCTCPWYSPSRGL
eukprot:1160121-Pelagomonas_calceolata.AAC.3